LKKRASQFAGSAPPFSHTLEYLFIMRIDYESILNMEESPLLRNKEESLSAPLHWSKRFGNFSATPRTMAFVGACCGLLVLLGALPESSTAYLPSFLVGARSGKNTIKICVKEMILTTTRDAKNAKIKCYDKDPNRDDLMIEGETGSNGCASMTYNKWSWWAPGEGNPDIYCTVFKKGFMQAVPENLNEHDPNTLAKMKDVILYRDRGADFGHVNGCGPSWTESIGLNGISSWATRFGKQCTMHDKCYWDCQIFLAEGNSADAQEFCDYEMREGMYSFCNENRGKIALGWGHDTCIAKANAIYNGLQMLGGIMAYDKTHQNCPDGLYGQASSMSNDYRHPDCYIDGYKCGYNGSTHDNLEKCDDCCHEPDARDRGVVSDDHYCKCYPTGLKCGSTQPGGSFDNCHTCCSDSDKKVEDGYFFDDYFCN